MLEAYLAIMASMLALILLLAPLERLAPAEKGQPSRRLLFNLLYGPVFYTFALAVGISAAPFLLAAAALATGGWILLSPGAGLAGQLLFALAFAFVWDLSQYGFHRLQHRIPFLWETHRFHHEETALSAAAYPRAHFIAVFGVVLFNLPLFALFGTQVPHAAAAFLLFPVWGCLTHSNLRLGFGPLTPLVVSPQLHRIHHSALPEHRDRNFANLFPVIDILFGTYYRPSRDEYPPTGLAGARVGNLRGATVQPFIAWWLMFKARHRRVLQPAASMDVVICSDR